METIAVYWEDRIKTYGFDRTGDLSLVTLAPEGQEALDASVRVLEETDAVFKMATASDDRSGGLGLQFVLDRRDAAMIRERLQGIGGLEVVEPVEMIHFQGPHYGDRYGIADSAFRTLLSGGVIPLAAGCTGSSISIILPDGQGRRAEALLSASFRTPNGDTAEA